MPTTPTFAIVGAGLAGAKAAEALRAEGFDGRLVLLGEEAERPYDRPPLSKTYLRGEADRGSLYLHDACFYAAHNIELYTSARVRSIDPPGRRLQLASGERISYQRLLLATGAAPRRLRRPGADLDGIYHLRNRRDADRLVAAVGSAARVVVIGTGWIGCEVAASVRQLGREVTLVGSEAVPLARVLGPEIGCFYRDLHAEQGVRLALGTEIDAFRGDGRVEAVVTRDGRTLPCDLVLVGIGAIPRTELAEAAGIAVGDGVLVDEWLETIAASTPPATSLPPGTPSSGPASASSTGPPHCTKGHLRPAPCSASPPATSGSPPSSPTSTTSAWSTRGWPPRATAWWFGVIRRRANSSPSGCAVSMWSPA
jgi:3-phenylpropionate/trans-cinnamate dioxygenase ferredoxin reductase subunit